MTDNDYKIAPCLREGPLSEAGQKVILSSRSLDDSSFSNFLRCSAIPYLFEQMESIFEKNLDPGPALASAMSLLSNSLEKSHDVPIFSLSPFANPTAKLENSTIEQLTGNHYGNLFKGFSDKSYWNEPKQLLETRLERNGILPEQYKGKKLLDVGCGGGRYTVAWQLLGVEECVGVDFSQVGIQAANDRIKNSDISGVSFEQGDVLNLPYADSSFNIVFSNGVLHHTTDWEKGISELLRVLSPGGWGWLYLIENPGGLFWDVIEILRLLTKDVDKEFARQSLLLLGMPANRIFYMLDHVLVPINLRLSPSEITNCLKSHGAIDIRRLERGADFDRVEQIFQQKPYASIKYGVGENRFVFKKSK